MTFQQQRAETQFICRQRAVSFGVIDAENLCTIAKMENDAKLVHNGHGATHKLRPALASKIVELFP